MNEYIPDKGAETRQRSLATTTCVVLAAGRGSRLNELGSSKPLVKLLGLSLIERALVTCQRAGMERFFVVTGHRAGSVARSLQKIGRRRGIDVTPLYNEQWEKGIATSVIRAWKDVEPPFLLTMADHLTEPSLLRRLVCRGIFEDEAALAVDTFIKNPLVDKADAVGVALEGERIRDMGKGLAGGDGYDTGAFLCTGALLEALEESCQRGEHTLTAGARLLAGRGVLVALKAHGPCWLDVDDRAVFRRAERVLLSQLAKESDGPVARYLNRPLSTRLSRLLVKLPLTPNQLSLASFGLTALAALLFTLPAQASLVAGGLLTQAVSILDGCDGEVARLKLAESRFGGWLDAVLDRWGDSMLISGLAFHSFAAGEPTALFWGVLALVGSFLSSYTADKHDSLAGRLGVWRSRWPRLGRDVRLLTLALGAVLGQPLLALAAIGITMNLDAARRVVAAYLVQRA